MTSELIHPSAIIDEGAEIGPGTKVWHFVHVSTGARIGARCVLGQNVFVGAGVALGDGVKVQNNVSIYEGVTVEDDVFLGPSCVFTNVTTPRAFVGRRDELLATHVGRGASIGANATVVCGNTIGAYAMIGAGAVVTHDVAPYALVVGSPARRIGWVSRAGERLVDGPTVRCPRTGERYVIDARGCRAVDGEGGGIGEQPAVLRAADLRAQHAPLRSELRAAFDRVVTSGQLVLGPEVERFERACAEHLGVAHAIGVSSGTDALLVALMALGVGSGDEVVTTPFTFFASAGCIARLGARPVFVDIDPVTFNLDPHRVEAALSPRTRAIVPVHLFGQPCAIAELRALSRSRGIPIVEDAAQAFGARTREGRVGGLGRIGCFSFFPTKILGALGDAGLVTTNDGALADRVRLLRSHGANPKYVHATIGGNFRLDALQAALLAVKLPHLETWTARRRAHAATYTRLLGETCGRDVTTPATVGDDHVFSQYVIRASRRDELRAFLASRGVETEVYYPRPLHLQACFAALGYAEGSFAHAERASREALALPVFAELADADVVRVAREIAVFLAG